MRLSEIFLKAAERYDWLVGHETDVRGPCGACNAIADAEHGVNRKVSCSKQSAAQDFFSEFFQPEHAAVFWWGHGAEDHQSRILALCFAAAIAESEARP